MHTQAQLDHVIKKTAFEYVHPPPYETLHRNTRRSERARMPPPPYHSDKALLQAYGLEESEKRLSAAYAYENVIHGFEEFRGGYSLAQGSTNSKSGKCSEGLLVAPNERKLEPGGCPVQSCKFDWGRYRTALDSNREASVFVRIQPVVKQQREVQPGFKSGPTMQGQHDKLSNSVVVKPRPIRPISFAGFSCEPPVQFASSSCLRPQQPYRSDVLPSARLKSELSMQDEEEGFSKTGLAEPRPIGPASNIRQNGFIGFQTEPSIQGQKHRSNIGLVKPQPRRPTVNIRQNSVLGLNSESKAGLVEPQPCYGRPKSVQGTDDPGLEMIEQPSKNPMDLSVDVENQFSCPEKRLSAFRPVSRKTGAFPSPGDAKFQFGSSAVGVEITSPNRDSSPVVDAFPDLRDGFGKLRISDSGIFKDLPEPQRLWGGIAPAEMSGVTGVPRFNSRDLSSNACIANSTDQAMSSEAKQKNKLKKKKKPRTGEHQSTGQPISLESTKTPVARDKTGASTVPRNGEESVVQEPAVSESNAKRSSKIRMPTPNDQQNPTALDEEALKISLVQQLILVLGVPFEKLENPRSCMK